LVPADVDICVYGGNSTGVIAAVQAARMGKSVVLVSPTKHLGGLTSSGLGFTDMGDHRILGGLTRDYFHRVWRHYQRNEAWRWQSRAKFANKGQHGAGLDDQLQIATVFEPHVAENIFNQLVAENQIPVIVSRLDRSAGVVKDGAVIKQIRTEDGVIVSAKIFIDATYEGDLMAAAGVGYTIGREANTQYGETLNGIQAKQSTKNQLPGGIDPYRIKGRPDSGLLPGVNADVGGADGSADRNIQAYCYRMCLTNHADNRITISKPAHYQESDYELLFRAIEAGQTNRFFKFSAVPNAKTDSNNDSGISTDYIGMNHAYPEADYATREKIAGAHKNWQLGLLWTLQNNPRVPEKIRAAHRPWGLPGDEFTDSGHFPAELYIREARRMIGDFIISEPTLRQAVTPQPIAMGAYAMDSHHTQRYVGADGHVRNEGDVQKPLGKPYQIDYRSITPKAAECQNLLVPVCLSATHIAYGSIRMEPVFMTLGQSAATAAALSIDDTVSVRQLDYQKLKSRLEQDGQVLSLTSAK
ncbi:MAG: FAD-dependent oxidoreductase, partial [Verrucomicrobiales bacterium]|nr:FAD-dependent oxidoreductase [Verrucomicrobiales bacterium]